MLQLTDEATEILPDLQDISEPDGKAHYIRVDLAIQGGVQVALCGKRWVPNTMGPEVLNMALCAECQDLMEMIKSMDGLI